MHATVRGVDPLISLSLLIALIAPSVYPARGQRGHAGFIQDRAARRHGGSVEPAPHRTRAQDRALWSVAVPRHRPRLRRLSARVSLGCPDGRPTMERNARGCSERLGMNVPVHFGWHSIARSHHVNSIRPAVPAELDCPEDKRFKRRSGSECPIRTVLYLFLGPKTLERSPPSGRTQLLSPEHEETSVGLLNVQASVGDHAT